MKNSITVAALAACLLVAACDKAPTSKANQQKTAESQNQKPGQQIKTYRFQSAAENCDTHKRTFETQIELCNAVQVSELNNNCAEPERLAFFAQNCADLVTIDENKARQALLNVDGSSVDCTLTERDLPAVRQFTGTQQMIMEHTSTRALVVHTAKLGKISLQLTLLDVATNKTIARLQKSWQDEAEPLTLSAPTEMGSPVLTCLVSLAQDPNRE